MIQAWRRGNDPLAGQKIWQLWERETGLNYASSLAKFSACMLPSLDQDCIPTAYFIGPIKALLPAQTEINVGPGTSAYPPRSAEAI